ncbi:MAG: sulfatase-like hydrolase/transferase [Deltaproteobacteria bacterium]|nr:sulfatase-like hydrolase/transferase [Deltaproteobacteria bacterium]
MNDSRKNWFDAILASMLVGLATAFLLDGIDLARILPHGGLLVVVSLTAMYLTVGLAVGLGVGLVAAGMKATLGKGMEDLTSKVAKDRAFDVRLAGWLLAAAASFGLLAAVVFMVHYKVSSRFVNPYLGALFIGGVSAAGAVMALAAFFPLWAFSNWIVGLLPMNRRTWIVLALEVGLSVAAIVVVITRADWRVLNLGPYVVGLILLAVVAAATGPAVRLARRLTWKGWTVVAAAFVVAVVCWPWAGSALNKRQVATKVLQDRSWMGGPFLKIGRKMTDSDGDGFASSFGGGDCNDHDSKIHPGAKDVPGDGIDQDCLAGDAKPPRVLVRINRARLAAADPLKTFKFKGNFVVIWVDTLREDRLGIEKYRRAITPNLDKLVSQSVFFRHAFSQGNRTPHSFSSFLTSRYPSKVAWKRPGSSYSPLSDSNLMIFEAMAQAGYRNVAVLRHFYFSPKRNLQQGFAPGDWVNRPDLTIKATNTDIAAPDVTARAIARLKELKAAGKPFVLWVHYPDPHSRYMTHPEFPITLHGIPGLMQKYDYEIKFADTYVGRLLAELDRLGMSKNTAVIVHADHGEAFGTHRMKGKRMFFHGQTLYNELLHVPLIMRVPGIKPRVVEDRVMLLDVASTMVDMIRKPIPKSFMGSSLVPYFFGKKLPPRIIRAEALPYPQWKERIVMMIQGKWKLIYRITDNLFELYDLMADPKEKHNLASRRREVLAKMKKEIMRF